MGAGAFVGAFVGAVAVAVVFAVLSGYVAWRALKGDEKFAVVRIFALAFGAIGGTSFSGADLTGAFFTQATLKNINFADSRQRPTQLTGVRWKESQKLDRARLGSSILQDPKVRHLAVSQSGANQDFTDCNLRGANLAEANLVGANFKRAILSEAILTGATMQRANLTESSCIGTDLTSAHLTGACLEAWNIDSTTILEQIDCQYVFLREQANDLGDRERRPHDPSKVFQPGDFEKYFREVLDEVQILIRNGVNPDAFKAAFQKIMEENPGITRDSVKAVAKQGEDVLLTLQVPEGTDKGNVEHTWDEVYAARLEAVRIAALLEGEQRRADDLKQVHLATVTNIGNLLSNLTFNTTAMNHDNSRSISIGGDANINTIQAGDGNIASDNHQQVSLPPPETVNIQAELTALQAILASLNDPVTSGIAAKLQAEAAKPNPDKSVITTTLETGLTYAQNLQGFAAAIDKLRPHVQNTAAWLGEHGYKLLALVGLVL